MGNDRIPKVNGSIDNTSSAVSEKKDRPVTEKTDQTSSLNTKESAVRIINNALSKRDGVREISSIFKGNDGSSHTIPPKITPKPKPVVRRTSDANNNSKSDTKESERTAEKKMTGTVDKENSSQTSSQSSPIGLSVHERAKLLANSGNLPNMKPDLASSTRIKGMKPPTSEKPISPAGTGSPKRFNIPKNKSQENVSVELRRVMVDSSDVRKILHRKSVKSVIRKSDDKRFRKVELDSIRDSGNVPVKPDPIYEEIDWEDLEKEFKRTVQEKGKLFLTHNPPIATKVVCFSRLLKSLRSLYGKQCGPRSDSSYRSSLFWVHAVFFYTYFVSNARQLFAADDLSRRHFQMHFFSWCFKG